MSPEWLIALLSGCRPSVEDSVEKPYKRSSNEQLSDSGLLILEQADLGDIAEIMKVSPAGLNQQDGK